MLKAHRKKLESIWAICVKGEPNARNNDIFRSKINITSIKFNFNTHISWKTLTNKLDLSCALWRSVPVLTFADDIVLMAVSRDVIELGRLLSEAAEQTKCWPTDIGLKLATHMSEALVITGTWKLDYLSITIDGHEVRAGKTLKGLGLLIYDLPYKFYQMTMLLLLKYLYVPQQCCPIHNLE